MKESDILIIDDNENIINFFKSIESRYKNVNFHFARSCRQAFSLLKDLSSNLKVVFSDIELPDCCGLDILNSEYLGNGVKKIIISGCCEEELQKENKKYPVVEYHAFIRKPICFDNIEYYLNNLSLK